MKDIRECSDPVMRASMAAIQRAAEDARRIAIQTGTELIAKLSPLVESTPDSQRTAGP